VAGAEVGPLPGGDEIGWSEIELTDDAADDPLLGGLPRRLLAFEWHGYRFGRPPGAVELARGAAGLQAFKLGAVPAWGIQFHAEATAATLADWLAKDAEEARAAGVDLERLAEQNRREITRWNDVGRQIGRGLVRYAAR
jgi:GMP synthase (glutamine-hydrolysing)